MSTLTTELLNRRPPRNARKWREILTQVADILETEYGTSNLGNLRDPVKEIFYIVLSAKTTEGLYRQAYRRLGRQFRTLPEIAKAPLAQIRRCVEGAGLGMKRSRQVKRIAQRLIADFGSDPKRAIRKMSIADAFRYLTNLPGVGPKSALCVLMYSLDADVFPVDANIQRVLCRMGAIPARLKHYQAQQWIPGYIPDGLSKPLHVGLLLHGRHVCRAAVPKCTECALRNLCKTGRQA